MNNRQVPKLARIIILLIEVPIDRYHLITHAEGLTLIVQNTFVMMITTLVILL